jgi:hypothetical protein
MFVWLTVKVQPTFISWLVSGGKLRGREDDYLYSDETPVASFTMLDCPEHRKVCPNRISVMFTLCLAPMNDRFDGVSEARADTVMAHSPSGPTVHGLDGKTVAPAGSPKSDMDSPGMPWPQIRAGVTPPRQGSADARTI